MNKSNLKNCKTCGAEIAKNAKICPSCGAKNKKPFYRRWWFILLVIIVFAGAIINVLSKTGVIPEPTSQPQKETSKDSKSDEQDKNEINGFEIIGEIKTESDGFNSYIVGTVKNNKGRELSYAQVEFSLYDGDGNVIGTAFDNIANLEDGATWKFKAIVLEDSFKKYKLTDITGF